MWVETLQVRNTRRVLYNISYSVTHFLINTTIGGSIAQW